MVKRKQTSFVTSVANPKTGYGSTGVHDSKPTWSPTAKKDKDPVVFVKNTTGSKAHLYGCGGILDSSPCTVIGKKNKQPKSKGTKTT